MTTSTLKTTIQSAQSGLEAFDLLAKSLFNPVKPTGDKLENLRQLLLKILGRLHGSHDIDRLSGDGLKAFRATIMSDLTGVQVKEYQAGIGKFTAEIHKQLGLDLTTGAPVVRSDATQNWLETGDINKSAERVEIELGNPVAIAERITGLTDLIKAYRVIGDTEQADKLQVELNGLIESKPIEQPLPTEQPATDENTAISKGDTISFNLSSNSDAERFTRVVEDSPLGLVVLVNDKRFELKKLLDVEKIKSADENTIEPDGKENQVKTAKGTKINTGFTVIEATKLITSHDETGKPNLEYPQELQPRDRARDTSQQQIAKIANNIDPDLLGRTRVAYQGAPIIGKDRVVESGNGRAIAINLAYKIGKADEYRDWLLEVADMYGISRSKIERMKRPVLVRVRTSDVDRVQFAMEANQSDMLAMTATEKAKSDANRLNDSLMSRLSGDGDLNSLANRDFIMDFLKSLGESEAAQYSTTDGTPTKQLYDRVQAALFAKAYNDDRLLQMMADSEKVEIANTIKALNQAAPHFIRARAVSHKVTDGVTRQVGDAVDLSLDDQAVNALIEATNVLKKAKDSGMNLEEFLKQTNVFGEVDDIDPVVAQMAIFIKENNRSSNRMGVAFQTMAEFVADELERRQNQSLFVDDPEISLVGVLKAANERLKTQFGSEVKTIGGGTGGFIDMFTETRGQKRDREAFLAGNASNDTGKVPPRTPLDRANNPNIKALNEVIAGKHDALGSEALLDLIENAANAIDTDVNNDLISRAMDKWLEVDNGLYLLDSVYSYGDTSGIMGWFDNTDDKGWIGVDLDGTLAHAGDWKGVEHIGKPVLEMLARVKLWVKAGKTVKIMTARAADKTAIPHIKKWLESYGLGDLEITNKKDLNMIALWDDRAVNVKKNTGQPTHDVLDGTHSIAGWFDNTGGV